jgi:hypothetical protein
MVPFQLLCVVAIWGLHTRYSRWLAARLAIWPDERLLTGEYRFDWRRPPAGVRALL